MLKAIILINKYVIKMSKCENCGFENEEDSIICRQCHYPLKESDTNDDNLAIDGQSDNNQRDVFVDNTIQHQETGNDFSSNSYRNYDGYFLIDSIEEIKGNDENIKYNKKKSVLLGCVLSFFITGMGNVYVGLTKRGIMEFIISLIINAFIPVNPQYIIDFNSYIFYIALLWEFYVLYDTFRCIRAINNGDDVPLLFGLINLK